MPEGGNALVAQEQDTTTAVTGIGIAESAQGLAHGVSNGDWVEAGLSAVSVGLEVLSMVIDPLGTLASYGVSWLIEHVRPLKEALDWFAGDPPVIQSFSETWANVAVEVNAVATEYLNEANTGTAGWTGQAGDAYRGHAAETADAVTGAATLADGISVGVMIMGEVVAFVREFIRDLVGELVGRLIAWALEAAATLGLATPAIVAQATAAISRVVNKVADVVRKLVRTIGNVSPRIRKIIDKLDEIIAKLAKLMRRGDGSTSPSAARPSAGGPRDTPAVHGTDGSTSPSSATSPSGTGTDAPSPGRTSEGTSPSSTDTGPDASPSTSGTSPGATRTDEPAIDNSAPARNSRQNSETPATDDPIDLATGRVFLDQTDVNLPGVLPLVLSRSHRSDFQVGRSFGRTWSSTVDQKIEVGDGIVHFAAADGMVLTYPAADPATAPVLPVHGTAWPLHRTADGGFAITDPQLGRTLRFAPTGGSRLPISAIDDRNGNRIDFVRDGSGDLVEIRQSADRRIAVTTVDGLITELSLMPTRGGHVVLKRYRYDDRRRLVEVVNSSGRPTTFEYDDAGRLTGWVDTNGMWYRYDYDAAGRCVQSRGTGGFLDCTLEFDEENRTTRRTNSLGHTTTYRLNDQFQIISETDPLGLETRYEWDRHHRLRSRTDPAGHTARYTYDENGLLIRVDRPDGATVLAEYDALGQPTDIVTADGALWRQEYDERGNRVAAADPSGAVRRFGYDERGHLVARTDPLGHATRIENDENGLARVVIAPDGATTRYDRDIFGRVSSITDPAGGVTRLSWTVEGKLVSRTLPDGTTERWTYDGEGNTVRRIDAAGNVTLVEINHFDLPVAETGPDGARTEYAYDTELRKIRVTNPQGLVWRFQYDAAGNMVEQTDYNGRVIRFDYDETGRIAARTNGNGETTAYRRDAMGNVVEEQVGGARTTFAYDPCGRLLRATNADADVLFERDPLGRVVAETVNGRTLESTYDLAGRRVRRRTPSGAESTWEYDATGRPLRLHTADGALRFGYDDAGRETRRTFGNVTMSQFWDANYRLRAQAVTAEGAEPAARGERVLRRRSYQYREDGRLVGTTDQFTRSHRYELDQCGRVTAVRGGKWLEQYAYDPAGNVVDARWPASSSDQTEHAAQGDRDYAGTLIRRGGRIHYEHDGDGRVLRRRASLLSGQTREWRYTWGAGDRLIAAHTPEGQHWRYRYDPFGRRIAKERMGDDDSTVVERIDFTWDGAVLAEQATAGRTTTWESRPGTPTPLAQREHHPDRDDVDREFYAIVSDLAGAPTELISSTGELVWQSETTLWGTRSASGEVDCALRFPGQYHDSETGLHYNYHRYYDPVTARYQSSDPIGLAASPNPHTYVANPSWQIDPFGLYPQDSPEGSGTTDPVVLYHGSPGFEGDSFDLQRAIDGRREGTPEGGVYLTDDFNRAATGYGRGGHVVRVEVPPDLAASTHRLGGPNGNQPEYFVNTPEGVAALNRGITDIEETNRAIIRWFGNDF